MYDRTKITTDTFIPASGVVLSGLVLSVVGAGKRILVRTKGKVCNIIPKEICDT